MGQRFSRLQRQRRQVESEIVRLNSTVEHGELRLFYIMMRSGVGERIDGLVV